MAARPCPDRRADHQGRPVEHGHRRHAGRMGGLDRHGVRHERPDDRARRAVAGPCLARAGPCRLCRTQPVAAPPPVTREDIMTAQPLAPYRVAAYNTAHDSENKIHDDATARRFGFGGGLVPGVDVYAYMTHMPVARWGRAWLEHGTAECRFFKPVYDGETATVTGGEGAGELEILVESRGERCATGHAALPAAPPAAPP